MDQPRRSTKLSRPSVKSSVRRSVGLCPLHVAPRSEEAKRTPPKPQNPYEMFSGCFAVGREEDYSRARPDSPLKSTFSGALQTENKLVLPRREREAEKP